MDKQKYEHYKKLLKEEEKRRKASLFDDRLGMDVSLKDATGELSSYDNHPGDMGTETFEAEKNMSFRNNDKFVLGEIDYAFNKMDNGSYGVCEACNRDIDEERLEVRPYSRFCIDCEKLYGQKGIDVEDGRPVEEQVLFPPFGRSFTDYSVENKVEFDGEDAWQAVNVYNVVTPDNDYDKEDSFGYVEDVEQINNTQYKKQLE